MFDKKKDTMNETNSINSVFRTPKGSAKVVIGEGVTLKGEITNADDVQIDGIADILLKTDNVTVGAKGDLRGTIEAHNADIWGKVDGELKISNTLTIQELGSVSGKIEYVKLQIKLGGNLTGDLSKTDNDNTKDSASKDKKAAANEDDNNSKENLI